jgi:hypothetical protein
MKTKVDVITGLNDQDARCLEVLASLLEKGLMKKDEVRAIVQVARIENVESLCKTNEERKVLNGMADRMLVGMAKKRAKYRRKTKDWWRYV